MLLAIDAGNTNVVFAIYEGDQQRGLWRTATDKKRTADEYMVWVTHLMALKGLRPADIDSAIIASVVPGATFNLKRLCKDHFGCDPLVVGQPGVDLGTRALVDRPDEVGADRLVNTVAAAATYQTPLIVIDFGTATTFDVVDRDGNYRGGVIAPGLNLSLEALQMAASKLPRVEIQQPGHVIGTNTVACMQSGVFWGYVGLIEGLVNRIRAEYGEPMTVVATGGLGVLFAKATHVIEHTDGELTLRGLLLIHKRNTAQ
ncbi:type III pantothenate kinase [Azospirillum argentinense]|uniref:Type III pantothenate kinase n=2 Tax=Azospirillum TaxID=191 RepID=A0A4D8PW79_AZOBR|nr:type III pantothenate kinase [Azospirillum argentinense]QCN93991.1 type III pantothenate kinase [Azospirillum argentinense]QCO01188.1 type III pantothenate kinase [Azospirillum argentinense]